MTSSRVAPAWAYAMFSWIVAENRNGLSSTIAICWRRSWTSTERTSAPSIVTEPVVTSYSRGSSDTRTDLPEPIAPTSATVCPPSIWRSTPVSAGWVEPSNVSPTSRNVICPGPGGTGGASGGETICGSRSRISKIRAPDALARWAEPSMYPSVCIGEISISR